MMRRIYRLLLYLYPSELRERFGDEMVELAHQQRKHPFLLARDFVTSVVSARVQARRARSRRRAGARWTSLGKDIDVAFRGMRRAPGFAVVAVATIALGVGASTAIFSVVNAVVLQPLPYDDPDRLVTIWSRYPDVDGGRGTMSWPDVLDIQDGAASFEVVAAYSETGFTVTGMGDPRVVPGARVSAGLFDTLGVSLLRGRDIRRQEDVPGGPHVVILGHRFWHEQLGGQPGVLGKTLTLDGESYEVIGVAPEGFDFPSGTELWRPRYLNVEDCGRGCHTMRVVGRLVEGVTLDHATRELTLLADRLEQAYPDTNTGKTFAVISLTDTIVGSEIRTALFILLAAVSVVLLIASANVAHLVLARATSRRGEMAIRSALGASRFRIVRQLFVEAVVLAGLGGLGGVLLGGWTLDGLLALAPANLPRLDEVSLDVPVLAFALLTSLAACLVSGFAPAVFVSRSLASRATLGDGSPGHRRSRSVLLAAEVALSLVLLFCAALLIRSLSELRSQELGFDPEGVLTFTISLPDADYPELEGRARFFEALERRLKSLAAVDAVGSVYGSPMARERMSADITFFDRPAPPPGKEQGAVIRAVTPGYLEALGGTLIRGRGLEAEDRRGALRVAIVNESFAERFYPGRDPIGERIRLHGSLGLPESEPRTIVGVVGDVRNRHIAEPATAEVWVPQAQMASSYMSVVVRARGDVEALLASVRDEVHRLDPNLPLRRVETLESAVERAIGEARFYSWLLSLFAGLAIFLASVGLYGVVSYIVSQRRREIGLRMALGAESTDIIRLVVGRGLRPTFVGIALGLVGALAGSQLLRSMLYNVEPIDVTSLVLATVGLLLVAGAALSIPARRASGISPTSTLRMD